MKMYLAGVPVYTIMLIGRWSIDAFLRYIRKQVKQSNENVSALLFLNNPRCHTSHLTGCQRTSPGSATIKQCQEKEKYWTQHVTTGATTGLLLLQLINQGRKAINGGGIISLITEGVRGGES